MDTVKLSELRSDFATLAEYFRMGIETGTIEPNLAKDWADQVIARSEQAPGDIVEIALSHDVPQLLLALEEVNGDHDSHKALCWLFGILIAQLDNGRAPQEVIMAAKHSAMRLDIEGPLYESLCSIDSSLDVAELGYFGTVPEVMDDLRRLLAQVAASSPPPLSS